MIHATIRPHPIPASHRLALAAVLAGALVAGLCSCVAAQVHDTAVKLHAQIEALHESSMPPVASTPEQVDLWQRAWQQAITTSARLVEVSK